MKASKFTSFSDRQTTSKEAKQALLAKFKAKPAVTDPQFEERRLQKQIELEELREKRVAERQAKRQESQKKEAERLALEAEIREAEELELRARQKALRDARYAARKQRRK